MYAKGNDQGWINLPGAEDFIFRLLDPDDKLNKFEIEQANDALGAFEVANAAGEISSVEDAMRTIHVFMPPKELMEVMYASESPS